jgi:hypothetical protein
VLPANPDLLRAPCLKAAWVGFAVAMTALALSLNNARASVVEIVVMLMWWQYYSAPPLALNGGSMGIDEAIVALVLLAGIFPLFGYFVAVGSITHRWATPLVALIVPIVLLFFSRQLMMNVPAIEANLKAKQQAQQLWSLWRRGSSSRL